MAKHYIIASTNDNPTYYTFLPTVYKMWKKYIPDCVFVLGFVGTKEENDPFVQKLKNFCDEFYYYKTLEGVQEGCHAKTIRMYMATLFGENICTLIDIDLYLLNLKWLLDKIEPAFTDNKFVSIGYNIYDNTNDEGKFPMCYSTASGNVWKKLININNLSYEDWFKYISNISDNIDNKENITNPFNNFSDESLLRYLIVRHEDQEWIKNKHAKLKREDCERCVAKKRLDRGWWPKECNYLNVDYIRNRDIIDVVPRRPFNKNLNFILPVLIYIGINSTIQEALHFEKR